MFISFEGIDGSGKSTLANLLCKELELRAIDYIFSREPGGTKLGEKIRNILLDFKGNVSSKSELLLFLAARNQQIEEIITPALNNHKWLVVDRFCDSTYAYQVFGRGLDLEETIMLNNFATESIVPNKTFYIKIDPCVAISRQTSKDRISCNNKDFYNKVSNGFDYVAGMYPERIITLDGSQTPEELMKIIKRNIFV